MNSNENSNVITLWDIYSEEQQAIVMGMVRDCAEKMNNPDEQQEAVEALVENTLGYWGLHQPLVVALAMNILNASGFPGSGSNYATAKLLVNLREFAQVTKAS